MAVTSERRGPRSPPSYRSHGTRSHDEREVSVGVV